MIAAEERERRAVRRRVRALEGRAAEQEPHARPFRDPREETPGGAKRGRLRSAGPDADAAELQEGRREAREAREVVSAGRVAVADPPAIGKHLKPGHGQEGPGCVLHEEVTARGVVAVRVEAARARGEAAPLDEAQVAKRLGGLEVGGAVPKAGREGALRAKRGKQREPSSGWRAWMVEVPRLHRGTVPPG